MTAGPGSATFLDPSEPGFGAQQQQYDIDQLNLMAAQYGTSAAQNNTQGVGGAPDPQMFADTAGLGATPALSSSFGQSAGVDRMLSALPASQAPIYTAAAQVPDLSQQNLQSLVPQAPTQNQFNPTQYLAQSKQDIASNKNNEGQWKTLGEVPIANQAYASSIVNSTDPSRIKSWQSFLVGKGLGDDPATKKPMPVTGTWNQNWLQSLGSFFVARFAPDALWSKNPTVQQNATTFLQSLGWDKTKQGNTSSDIFKGQVIDAYVHTAGDNVNPKDTLSEIASNYGADVLDKAHNAMLNPGFFQSVMSDVGQVTSLLNNMVGNGGLNPALAIFGKITGLKTPADLEKQVTESVYPDWAKTLAFGETSLSKETLAGYDTADQQALQQLNGSVTQESGVFGLLDGYQRRLNQGVVATRYFLTGAPGTSSHNPFDDWQAAAASSSNPMAGVFGDTWVANNPITNTIGNFAISTFDDPLTYVGGLGMDAKIDLAAAKAAYEGAIADGATAEEAMAAARKEGVSSAGLTMKSAVSRKFLLSPAQFRDTFSSPVKGILDVALRPNAAAAREALGTFLDPKVTAAQLTHMLDITDPDIVDELVAAKASGDVGKVIDFLDQNVRHKLLDPSRYTVINEASKAFGDDFARLGPGQQQHLLSSSIRGANHFNGTFLSSADWGAQRDGLLMTARVANLTQPEIDEVMQMLVERKPDDQISNRLQAMVDQAKKDGRLPADLDQQIAKTKSGLKVPFTDIHLGAQGGAPGAAGRTRMYLPVRGADGQAVEASKLVSQWTYSDPADQAFADAARGKLTIAQNAVQHYQQTSLQSMKDHLDQLAAQAGGKYAPATDDEAMRALQQDQPYLDALDNLQTKASDIVDQMANLPSRQGVEGEVPAAAFSSQFTQGIHLPFNPYDVLVTRSPFLQKAEQVQRALHLDELNNWWKSAVTARISSALKIPFSDDFARVFFQHLKNSPTEALRYLSHGIKKRVENGSWTSPNFRDMPTSVSRDITSLFRHDRTDYHAMLPTDAGYGDALYDHITQTLGESPEAKAWVDGMKAGGRRQAVGNLVTWLRGGSPEAEEFLRRDLKALDPLDPKSARQLGAWAASKHDQFATATMPKLGDPEGQFLIDALSDSISGSKSKAQLKKEIGDFAQRNSGNPDRLPLIVGKRPYTVESGIIPKSFKAIPSGFAHGVTGNLVQRVRAKAYDFQVEQNMVNLRKVYSKAEMSDAKVEKLAANDAAAFMQHTTYQFNRSMTGHALRNISPFWGATASMTKFWSREAIENPFFAKAASMGIEDFQKAHDAGQLKIKVPMTGWLMRKMGMTNADDLTWDPSNALYFGTYAGFVPSLGPFVMGPLNGWANANPDVANFIKTDPILNKIMDPAYVGSTAPLFPWLGKAIQGTEMALGQDPSSIPLITAPATSYEGRQAAISEEQEAAHLKDPTGAPDPTTQSVNRELGGETIAGALGSFVTPGSITVDDATHTQITAATTALDAATTDAQKQQVMEQNPTIAPLLAYRDYTLAPYLPGGVPINKDTGQPMNRSQLGDYLVGTNPWIAAYASGITKSNDPSITAAAEPSTARFDSDINSGMLQYLKTPEIVANAHNQIESSSGWLEWNRANDLYQQSLTYYGTTATTTLGKQIKATVMDPVLSNLQTTNPTFWTQFSSSSGATDPGKAGMPLNTAAVWNSLPFGPGRDTPTTNAWRQLLVWKSQLGGEIAQLTAQGGTAAQKQAVADQFATLASQLAQTDPTFAEQISKYSYKNVEDIVNAYAAGDY